MKKAMTNSLINPWATMQLNSIRRADPDILHSIFWMKAQDASNCFYIKIKTEFSSTEINIDLKKIDIVKRNNEGYGELFLISKDEKDWELFLVLCNDIIVTIKRNEIEHKMIFEVQKRLKQWQNLLKQNTNVSFSLTHQMGLFAELFILIDILIPRVGVPAALLSWVGADHDKQDFSLLKFMIEAKSYLSSKGPKITISSAHQLFSTKPIYIAGMGLTLNSNGKSVIDLISEIEKIILQESIEVYEEFERKLLAQGYMPGLKYSTIHKFNVDSIRFFEVNDSFPKLLPNDIRSEIVSVKYIIDLQLCTNYEVALQNLIDRL